MPGSKITCPHLIDGRCKLAELLAARVLRKDVTCPVDDTRCGQCLAAGVATEEQPTIHVTGAVSVAIAAEDRRRWAAYASKAHRVTPHVQAAVEFKAPPIQLEGKRREVIPKPVCVHRGESIGEFPCGCNAGGTVEIYACPVKGKCIAEARFIERAVEHMRKEHPGDREARRVAACDNCPQSH